jgi:hypothetical protein
LDSASLNYPGTDTLVPAIELAEICVMLNLNLKMDAQNTITLMFYFSVQKL